MEKGQPIWLKSTASHWGWVPALVHNREEVIIKNVTVLRVTIRDDPRYNDSNNAVTISNPTNIFRDDVPRKKEVRCDAYGEIEPFEITLTIDVESFSRDELDDIKIRDDSTANVGSVDDLIGLTHLHEPAILHALRVRYEEDVIYTSTGPILIAINPFKPMEIYSQESMDRYRLQGEGMLAAAAGTTKSEGENSAVEFERRLPPHAYLTADDAYRAMIRGIEIGATSIANARKKTKRDNDENETPINQSILVSGESGAGKTVTTKIVLNYFAMLSKLVAEQETTSDVTPSTTSSRVEQQVLDSNPILESFGNARTIRNDNSSRFGKYIDIRFSSTGRLTGARIDTYLLEKVRLIRQTEGERNFHVFYQLLESATEEEWDRLFLGEMQLEDFRLVNQSGTYDRRDMVDDKEMHKEMLDAMATMGFDEQVIKNILRLMVAVLYAGNMTFTETTSIKGDTCTLDETEASEAVACLLGVSFDKLAAALTSRVLFLKEEVIVKELSAKQAHKASEALMKSIYGANFDYIVKTINESIYNEKVDKRNDKSAYIGVLDIFGFESFEVNSFEQLCINYTNETLQQHFNKHVFKMEQQEYEREGILWKFISFPDNQDVLDLIDRKRTGILAVLDELCIVEWGTDDKFTHALYTRCEKHDRFDASPQQQAVKKFSVEHYAGPVEYSTDEWIEKNKDQLPAASVELLESSNFSLLNELKGFVRAEGAGGRGSVAMKSLSAKFSEQLKDLRKRIDLTDPHYIRCLKPNDELLPNDFDPKNIVEQLRYSGVLEAVRVSRAGYPTRYPHALFLSRYYMLGDLGGDGNKRSKDIVELVKWIAFHIWEHDNQRREAKAILAANESKSKVKNSSKKNTRRMNAQSNIDIPETTEDFNKLDFSTRCAVAGLQLGRTKVFLRREAFDRIESLRAILFGNSASVIQAQIRGRVQRIKYFRLKTATAKTQAAIRYFLANLTQIRQRKKEAREKWASSTIQLAYRRHHFRSLGAERRDEMLYSASIMQALARSFLVRLHLDDMIQDKAAAEPDLKKEVQQENTPAQIIKVIQSGPSMLEISIMMAKRVELFQLLADGKWDAAISLMDQHKQLAEQREDETDRLPLHVVAGHNLHHVFDQVYSYYPEAANIFDGQGRLPIHVAAEEDALVPLRYLLTKHPEGADTMMLRPAGRVGGGIPLHIACRTNASSSVITALLSCNFNSTKKSDANGDLPVHLLLRNGDQVSEYVAQALLDIYPTAATRADMYGDLPLSVALKHNCKPEVVKVLLMHNPEAAKVQNGRDGHSALFLAFQHHANDKTILSLMNHAPDLIVATDKRTGMLPIEMATSNGHSKEIVQSLLRHDMPIDMKEKSIVKLISHQHSWTHLVSQSNDMYHDVVSNVLEHCSQPQILALSQIPNKSGETALATATPLCKYEFRIAFRLFRTLEVVDTAPAYTNDENGVQIFYALRYSPPPEKMGFFTTLYNDDKSKYNHVEPWDDLPVALDNFEDILDLSNLDIDEKLKMIKSEHGKRVIAKLTSRSDIANAEMSKREEHQLSRHYVPAIISVHHTIQYAAYAEAMAEPSYCITMEGADITAENMLLDLRKSGGFLSKDHLKSIAISLLHIHDHGLVHGDFGSHNVAKFGDRWKILGISASKTVGSPTDPNRGFFHPPEAVVLETRNVSLGEKNVGAAVVSINSAFTYDIWAFGTIIYEALAGLPLSPYRSAYKAKRAMTTAELFKVGQWDDRSLRKALRHIDDETAQDLIKKLLDPDPDSRVPSMRDALKHPYFGLKTVGEKSFTMSSDVAECTERVSLKIYSEKYMDKMGWSDADVADMFRVKEINPADDNVMVVVEEEQEHKVNEKSPKDDTQSVAISSEMNKDTTIDEELTPPPKLTELPAKSNSVGNGSSTTELGNSTEYSILDRVLDTVTCCPPTENPSQPKTLSTESVNPPKSQSQSIENTSQSKAPTTESVNSRKSLPQSIPATPPQPKSSTPQTKSKSKFKLGFKKFGGKRKD